MSEIDVAEILDLRRNLRIVHHVPGRIRFRIGTALYRYASSLNKISLGDFLAAIDGVHDLRINPAAATLVIQYDPGHFPPELWQTLIEGSDQEAEVVIGDLVASYESKLKGVLS